MGYVCTIVWQKEMFFMGYNRQCGSLWWWWLTFLYNEIALRLSEKGQMCIPVSSLTNVCFLSRTGLLVSDMTRKTLFLTWTFFLTLCDKKRRIQGLLLLLLWKRSPPKTLTNFYFVSGKLFRESKKRKDKNKSWCIVARVILLLRSKD